MTLALGIFRYLREDVISIGYHLFVNVPRPGDSEAAICYY